MTSTFSNITINNLPEVTFIAGSYKELAFYLNTEEGVPIDVTYFDIEWNLRSFSDKSHVILTKKLTGNNGYCVAYLYSADTENVSGKCTQTLKISVMDGYVYNVAQGTINIIAKIGVDNYE